MSLGCRALGLGLLDWEFRVWCLKFGVLRVLARGKGYGFRDLHLGLGMLT